VKIKRKAPWNDFKGNPIHDGDTIEHPDGRKGVVVFIGISCLDEKATYTWRVDYGDGPTMLSRLCLQIGDKGQAEVVS